MFEKPLLMLRVSGVGAMEGRMGKIVRTVKDAVGAVIVVALLGAIICWGFYYYGFLVG